MTDHNDSHQAIATQPTSPGRSSQELDRVNGLFGVLAPIRAVGMNDDMASDWSAVIISECSNLTDAQFMAGCRNAKRECSDHRGVLKAILQGAESVKPCPFVKAMAGWGKPVEQIERGKTQTIGKLTEGYVD